MTPLVMSPSTKGTVQYKGRPLPVCGGTTAGVRGALGKEVVTLWRYMYPYAPQPEVYNQLTRKLSGLYAAPMRILHFNAARGNVR